MRFTRIICASVMVCTILIGAMYTYTSKPSVAAQMAACADLQNRKTPASASARSDAVDACYEKTARESLETMSARDFLLQILATDSSGVLVRQCHKIEHIVAMESYKRTKSLEDTIRDCYVTGCGNGCTHGAVAQHAKEIFGASYDAETIAHIDAEQMRTLGESFCKKDPALCHAIGHVLVMYGTLDSAVQACKNIAPQSAIGDCYTGVFMEYTQDSTSFSYQFPEMGTAQHSEKPFDCSTYSGILQRMCYLYFPAHVRLVMQEEGIPWSETHMRTYPYCASIEDRSARAECFLGIGYTDGRADECAYATNPRDEFFCKIGAGIYYKHPRESRITYCNTLPGTVQQEICLAHFKELYVKPGQSTSL